MYSVLGRARLIHLNDKSRVLSGPANVPDTRENFSFGQTKADTRK